MSFLKNILGAFVEFKENDKESLQEIQPQRIEKNTAPVNNNPVIGATSVSVISSAPGAAPSYRLADYQKHFEDLIEEANANNALFKGTDFKEFIDSKTDVEAITDEPTKYRTAFNVLKRTGLTKERLISTGGQYINIIENDLKAFESAYMQQYKADVEMNEQLLEQKTKELQVLSEKIAVLNQQMKEIRKQVTESKDQLNATRNSFILAGENKKKEIKTELQKIEQYF